MRIRGPRGEITTVVRGLSGVSSVSVETPDREAQDREVLLFVETDKSYDVREDLFFAMQAAAGRLWGDENHGYELRGCILEAYY